MTNPQENTLMEIFLILKRRFRDFSTFSDTEMERIVRTKKEGKNKLDLCTQSLPKSQINADETSNTSTDDRSEDQQEVLILPKETSKPESQTSLYEPADIMSSYHYATDHNLHLMRENVDLKLQIQQIQEKLAQLQSDQSVDDNVRENLDLIDGILQKVECTQTNCQLLCEKLCEGIDKMKNMKRESNSEADMPVELKRFCDRIRRTVGKDYIQLGRELGLQPDVIIQIEEDYSEVDGCLYQIVLEWCKRQDAPSIHTLVAACHNVNPDILKCKPLSNAKARLLESKYSFLYDEMHELAVLPYLVSAKVMTLKLQSYVIKPPTRDQRICRLLSILCTRENGFEEFCNALEKSHQTHVASILKDELSDINDNQEVASKKIEKLYFEITESTDEPVFRSRRYFSQNDLDRDDGKMSDFSSSSSPVSLDPFAILLKIADLIRQVTNSGKACDTLP